MHSSYHPKKSTPFETNNKEDNVVVVGKIIIDDYHYRSPSSKKSKLTIGGGGPQAAWGAAAALATLTFSNTKEKEPPKQNVTLIAPIGRFTSKEHESLHQSIGPAIQSIHLIQNTCYETPRIQLWHDEEQNVQWKPIGDTWGSYGADSLWDNRPSANDILQTCNQSISNLHVLCELGSESPGKGKDCMFLTNETLLQNTNYIGIEPIAFPEENDGILAISNNDIQSSKERLSKLLSNVDIIIPDSHLFDALQDYWNTTDIIARCGPNGSKIPYQNITIPVATLETKNAKVVNPTGAGNAYSAALSTCRSKGLSLLESACVATAIGAIVCEYENLPPWEWGVIERILRGALEVLKKVEFNLS